ncbi:MAG: hypothetical protein RR075_00730, partial [Pygmaiobacter sp.]
VGLQGAGTQILFCAVDFALWCRGLCALVRGGCALWCAGGCALWCRGLCALVPWTLHFGAVDFALWCAGAVQ